MTTLGVDIGGTSVKAAATDGRGAWRTASSARHDPGDPGSIRDAVGEAVGSVLAPGDTAATVGVCVPGVLDAEGERVTYAANLPGLTGVEVRGLLPATLRAAVAGVWADAVCAGVGVWRAEPVSGRLLTLAIGTGVGACVLDDGRPVALGERGVGHVGQLDVSLGPDAPPGPDGGRGSLEAYIGAPALRARFGEDLPRAVGAFDESEPALRALARAIRICHAVYTPDHVRLCGGVGGALTPATPALRSLIERDLTLVARERWSLACVEDTRLGAKGAAHLAAQLADSAASG